ncbi:MAG: hypothetical protein ACKO5F_05490 [Synechococcus sp.]
MQDSSRAIVLTSAGASGAVAAGLAAAAPALAAALDLPLEFLEPQRPPAEQLAALLRGPLPRLLGLPVDPGLFREDGSHWAEALGAWRQPTLVLLPAAALESGAPAAAVALLRQWQVPLLGVVQAGGPWQAGLRRSDGLPWLGWLPSGTPEDPEHQEALEDLRRALALRYPLLEAELA